MAPGIWYQMHQVVDGKINVTGVALPGQPFIISGHNEQIAWGMTNVMVDDMDFYLEKINPANPDEYEFNGAWRPMEVRKEKIKVKGGKIIERELRFTHRGPIISDFQKVKGHPISMRWIANEYSNELRSVYLLNRASNWDEFRNAVKTFRAISQNIVFADADGNIGLYCCAGVPLRKGNGITIAPGETDEYDWTGFVPFEELPHSYNPSCGYVSSANNRTADDDYPYYISHWFDLPYRIDRIREMIEEKERFSAEDFTRMQADFKSKLLERMKEEVTAELNKSGNLTPLEQKALELLESWDCIYTKGSAAPSIFEKFYNVLLKNLLEDEMGDGLFKEYLGNVILVPNFMENILRNRNSEWCDDITTKNTKETFNDMVQKSFKEAVNSLRDELGQDPAKWVWGKIHALTITHPMGKVRILNRLFNLNRGPFPVGGSFHTVCPYRYYFTNVFEMYAGASMRHVYSLANWDESLTVIPTGTSGIPASPHYCDQTKLYAANQYHSDYVSRGLIEKEAKYKMLINGK
jgi:penicillin amidase